MDKYNFISDQLRSIAVLYELEEWTSNIKYPYWTGEFTEEPVMTEDGAEESTVILNGFNRGKAIDLVRDKEKIKQLFDPTDGLRAKTGSGSIAVFFDGSFSIPTGEADLKRMQINLKIKEWKGKGE